MLILNPNEIPIRLLNELQDYLKSDWIKGGINASRYFKVSPSTISRLRRDGYLIEGIDFIKDSDRVIWYHKSNILAKL